MTEKNLYKITFDFKFQNIKTHRKLDGGTDIKTVVANGDASTAIKKLVREMLHEPHTYSEDDKTSYRIIDVRVRSVERVAKINYP